MSHPNKPKCLYITIPENVHRAAKAVAALQGRQLGDVVADAISAYVADRFPQLGDLGSSKSSEKPKSPKSPKQPPAVTGPGSPGYVAPVRSADDEPDEVGELPLARDDENPFEDMGCEDP